MDYIKSDISQIMGLLFTLLYLYVFVNYLSILKPPKNVYKVTLGNIILFFVTFLTHRVTFSNKNHPDELKCVKVAVK